MINHAIISRCRFKDCDKMDKYLAVAREYLVPQLKAQTCQDFKWFILSGKNNEQYLKDNLDYELEVIENRDMFAGIMMDYNIQTRHDIDDWMDVNYVELIQNYYRVFINTYNTFVIHAQPKQLNILSNKEYKMRDYRSNNTSMFVSLCQKEPEHNVFSRKHNQLWRLGEKVLMLPGTPVKWIIHGNNITCKKK